MWQVKSCKTIDTFKWSPKGSALKKGKIVRITIGYQCIQQLKMVTINILTKY